MNFPRGIYLLRLFPFLIVYVFFVLHNSKNEFEGDEFRYIQYANNLLNGYFSPPQQNYFWNGPGYPIFLIPFVFFKLPILAIKITNAFLHFLSVYFLFETLRGLIKPNLAYYVSIFWGLYFIAYQEMPFVLTESLTIFLVSFFLFISQIYYRTKKLKYLILSGISLGYLILTKIIFGYVILLILLFLTLKFLLQLLLKLDFHWPTKEIKILLIAKFICLPYLIYTFNQTGKLMYYGNSGGMNLYWMSTPFEDEYGDWVNNKYFEKKSILPQNLYQNHIKEISFIERNNWIKKDSLYKEFAVNNIKTYPVKYLKNILYNIGRMWFNFPLTGYIHSKNGVFRLFINSILFTVFIFSFLMWAYTCNEIDSHVNFIFLILIAYLFLSSLVSALPRQLNISVPWIVFSSSAIFFKFLNKFASKSHYEG